MQEILIRVSIIKAKILKGTSSNLIFLKGSDRDRKSYRLRDQRWYDSSYRDEIFSATRGESNSQFGQKQDDTSSHKKSNLNNPNSISFGEQLEFWTEKVYIPTI